MEWHKKLVKESGQYLKQLVNIFTNTNCHCTGMKEKRALKQEKRAFKQEKRALKQKKRKLL